MHKTQKVLTTALWGLMVLIMVSVISAGLFLPREPQSDKQADAPAAPHGLRVIGEAPSFSLIDQNGQPLSTDGLKGKVWVADFIFTHCAGPCRTMTQTMGELQAKLNDPSVTFVSITVDPDRDTPQVLKAYGDEFKADHSKWKFVTGDKELIYATARGMLLPVEPATADTPILHSERFVLVDADGKIRAAVHAKEGDLDQFIADIRTVSEQARKR